MNTSITSLSHNDVALDVKDTLDNNSDMIRNIHALAQQGFKVLRTELDTNSINAGDAMLAFHKCDPTDEDKLTWYFCLSITMLNMKKDELNSIGEDVYNKLLNFVVSEYNKKVIN